MKNKKDIIIEVEKLQAKYKRLEAMLSELLEEKRGDTFYRHYPVYLEPKTSNPVIHPCTTCNNK